MFFPTCPPSVPLPPSKAYATPKKILSDLVKYQKYAAASPLSTSLSNDAERFMDVFISEKNGSSRRGILTGVCLFGISPLFPWLTTNSLQITRTDWIGEFSSFWIMFLRQFLYFNDYFFILKNELMKSATNNSWQNNKLSQIFSYLNRLPAGAHPRPDIHWNISDPLLVSDVKKRSLYVLPLPKDAAGRGSDI